MSGPRDDLRHLAGTAIGWTRTAVGQVDAAVADQLEHLPGPVASAGRQARAVLLALVRLPLPTEAVQALAEQLHAQRSSIHAMQAQLEALDHQLRLLEESLRPVEAWVGEVQALRDSLLEQGS